MTRDTRRGAGNLPFAASLLIVAVIGYLLFQLLYPFYAFRSLVGTMEESLRISGNRSDGDHTEILEEVRWVIDRYNIPLDPNEIQIDYDPERKVLSAYAEYDVYVDLPGYTHHYHFEPYAEAEAD